MKNIELKISIDNFRDIIKVLKKIGARYNGTMRQVDIYYFYKNGRLKLRYINNKIFELIFYQRPDKKIGKISNYQILKIKPEKLNFIKFVLDNTLGKRSIIRKERHLWIYRNTRIHLDTVHNLGKFVELETVIRRISLKEAKKQYNRILKLLKILNTKIQKESYSDLLEKNYLKNNKKPSQIGLDSLMMPSDLLNSIQYQLKK
jgi:predicted adenylyl cyclase CyaB